ncbi:MAG: hypothetical protein ACP5IX_00590 [Patescibacteria group bacterium]
MPLFSSKKNNQNTFNPKELNRKQLQQQNLIFVISAIIIIIGLIAVVAYTINFLVRQMDDIFGAIKNTNVNLEGFNVQGFNEIKDKLPITGDEIEKFLEELEKTETTTQSPTISPEQLATTTGQLATTTPITNIENEETTSTLENLPTNQTVTSSPQLTPTKTPITLTQTPTPTLTISPSPTTP